MHNTVHTKGYWLLVDGGSSPIDDGELIYSYVGDEITYKNRDSRSGTYRRIIGYLPIGNSEALETMRLPQMDQYGMPYGFDICKIEGDMLVGEYLYQYRVRL